MTGPYPPPRPDTDPSGSYHVPATPPLGYGEPASYEAALSVPRYPGPPQAPLAPAGQALPYPRPPRKRALAVTLAALALVAGVAATIVFAVRDGGSASAGLISPDSAQRAIQQYLDALASKDLQVISRNALCGLYEGVRDRRSDDALARMASDAFQKQFSKTEVTSVDTLAFQSANSAQALFTMRTAPARGAQSGPEERQGVAQLMVHGNEVLVCSYVLRTAGVY